MSNSKMISDVDYANFLIPPPKICHRGYVMIVCLAYDLKPGNRTQA